MTLPQGAVGLMVCAAAAALIEKKNGKNLIFTAGNKIHPLSVNKV